MKAALRHHDESVAINQFTVFDSATVAFDFQPYLKSQSAAKPVDSSGWVIVINTNGQSGPTFRCRFHDQ